MQNLWFFPLCLKSPYEFSNIYLLQNGLFFPPFSIVSYFIKLTLNSWNYFQAKGDQNSTPKTSTNKSFCKYYNKIWLTWIFFKKTNVSTNDIQTWQFSGIFRISGIANLQTSIFFGPLDVFFNVYIEKSGRKQGISEGDMSGYWLYISIYLLSHFRPMLPFYTL